MAAPVISKGSRHRGKPFTVAIASGKGGTGKTFVATGLAVLASARARVVLVDCDVEAPNDHLFLAASKTVCAPVTASVASVDSNACTACGTCSSLCAYGAVRVLGPHAVVFEDMCHGCGLCVAACPSGVMAEVERRVGEVCVGDCDDAGSLQLVTGRLDVGEVKAPAVIRAARRTADGLASDVVILDTPPGVACSSVASVKDADLLVLVTEPTPFGLHDLALAHRLGRALGVPMAIIVNRDTAEANTIDGPAREWQVPVVARIPFDRAIAEAYSRGVNAAPEFEASRSALEKLMTFVVTAMGDASVLGDPRR